MKDCWLSPYGEVIYISAWEHNTKAEQILIERYGYTDELDIDDKHPFETATCVLEKKGWMRFTTTIDRWSCEHTINYEELFAKPTKAQIGRMYELTGFNYYDSESYSKV